MTAYTQRDKREQCKNIIERLHGLTGSNFEKKMCDVLRVYYQALGQSFESVAAFGGDYKNDGWVKEDAIFYGMFSPFVQAVQKSIEGKFESDLRGLLSNLSKGLWGGKISSFIFVVNMRDEVLPPNPYDFFNQKVDTFKTEFKVDFTLEIKRPDDFLDKFCETFTDEDITNILMDFNIELNKTREVIHETDILSFIEAIGEEIIQDSFNSTKPVEFDGTRISPDKKIELNRLEEKEHEIKNILSKTYIIDNVVNLLADRLETEIFGRVREKVLSKYEELTVGTYDSVDVYNACVDCLVTYAKNKNMAEGCAKYIIVYLFEQCDLFKRVED